MNIQDKIHKQAKLILQKDLTIDDDVVDLIELLYARIDELLRLIADLRERLYDLGTEEEDIDTNSSNDISSDQYNEDYINRKDDLD